MTELQKPNTLHGWCECFRDIYVKSNENRKWSELIAMLGARICLLVSPKYYDGPGDFRWQFAKSVAWMLGIHNSQAKPFDGNSPFGSLRHVGVLLLGEFPKACPYCGREECNNDSKLHTSGLRREQRNATFAKYSELASKDANAKHFSLDAWAETILTIYPRDREALLSTLSGKLAEEFAELAKALRLYRRALSARNGAPDARSSAPKGLDTLQGDYCEEFADTFSRLCVFGKRVLGNDVSLDDVVWSVYKRGCPTCVPRLTPGPECACETVEDIAEAAVTLWDHKATLGRPVAQPPVNITNLIDIDNRSTANAESHAVASPSIHIRAGDFEGVQAALHANGVDDVDIEELRNALAKDPKPKNEKELGELTGAWVGRMVGKASRGLLKIGSTVAADLLTKIIAAYYGIPA